MKKQFARSQMHEILQWLCGSTHQYSNILEIDPMWAIITIILHIVILVFYGLFAHQWYKNQKTLADSIAKQSLQTMMNIFIYCGACEYFFSMIRMIWPVWRLTDIGTGLLLCGTLFYLFKNKGFKAVYLEINSTEKLRNDGAMFNLLASNVPQIIWTAGPDGKTDYVNEAWCKYTGMNLDASIKDGWHSTLHPDDMPITNKKWEDATATGTPFETELRIKNAAGKYTWFLSRATAVKDEHGKVIKWVGTSTDIEEQKDTQSLLQKAKDDGLAKLKSLTEELTLASKKKPVTKRTTKTSKRGKRATR